MIRLYFFPRCFYCLQMCLDFSGYESKTCIIYWIFENYRGKSFIHDDKRSAKTKQLYNRTFMSKIFAPCKNPKKSTNKDPRDWLRGFSSRKRAFILGIYPSIVVHLVYHLQTQDKYNTLSQVKLGIFMHRPVLITPHSLVCAHSYSWKTYQRVSELSASFT